MRIKYIMPNEEKITRQTRKYLEKIERAHFPNFWFQKWADKFTSGLPDYHGVSYGIPFYIELKATGKVPRKLQRYILARIASAGGKTLATDNIDEVYQFISSVVLNTLEVTHFEAFNELQL